MRPPFFCSLKFIFEGVRITSKENKFLVAKNKILAEENKILAEENYITFEQEEIVVRIMLESSSICMHCGAAAWDSREQY